VSTDPSLIWSCGGGTQSGAIAALIKRGKLARPDIAFMINTGRERSSTWPFVDGFIRPALAEVGLELQIVNKSDFATVDLFSHKGSVLMPGFTNINGTVGKLDPYCSGEWKREVGMRWLRSIGVQKATMWIGISIDEASRIRNQRVKWLSLFYPLIFTIPTRRYQCVDMIRAEGWTGHIPHSACFMCPNLSDAEWIDMKMNWPEDFALACSLETEVRIKDANFFLHPSCVPLAEVDFFAQSTMFPERGCTQGCFT